MNEDIKRMIKTPGVYIAGDKNYPDVTIVLVSRGGGRIFSTVIDKELDPDRFLETVTLQGPYQAGNTNSLVQLVHRIKELEKSLDREITYKDALEISQRRIKDLEMGIAEIVKSEYMNSLVIKEKLQRLIENK